MARVGKSYGPFLPSKTRRRAQRSYETRCRRGRGIQVGERPLAFSVQPTLEVQRREVAARQQQVAPSSPGRFSDALKGLAGVLGFRRWQRRMA